MVLDYSKWDALELSDDSDIEVHPNVDKKSFIRAKQNQIHQQRYQRRHEIDTLQYERKINNGLLERINALLDALKRHQDDARNPDELVFQSLIESAGDPAHDEPPQPPEGVYTKQKESMPKFSKMLGNLVDQVKKDVDEKKEANRYQSFVNGITGHLTKVQGLQQELLAKLASLEKEEKSKITSDSIRTGFNTSHVVKDEDKPKATPSSNTKVELLNPGTAPQKDSTTSKRPDDAPSSSSSSTEPNPKENTNTTFTTVDDDEYASVQPTPLGKQFAQLPPGDYRAYLEFITHHPHIIAERETDGLLVEAFNAELAHPQSPYARQCVHQALLLQYCGKLGRDGTHLFFKRITTKGHQAQKVFIDDVNGTYARIRLRAAELQKHQGEDSKEGPGVEQIQLHAVDPNTKIHIVVPEVGSLDPEVVAARAIFDAFPLGLQKALVAGSLDLVNEVLATMSVPEAEEVVQRLGDGGMLSLEEGVVDATTEEGRKRLKEIEEENRLMVEKGKARVGAGEDGGDVEDGADGADGQDGKDA